MIALRVTRLMYQWEWFGVLLVPGGRNAYH
jgi:hypothetical protein